MSRPRVVIDGLGETGVLTAVRLAGRYDVVGISTKPSLVSGQELGLRLTRPDWWARDYHHSFEALRGLDRARVLHGTLTGADLAVEVGPPTLHLTVGEERARVVALGGHGLGRRRRRHLGEGRRLAGCSRP